jgi:acyl-CoA dehydrogenase
MSFRRDFITKPIFSWARGVLPSMSDTEREALEAGDVWWDADLFTGDPDWSKLLAFPQATLTDEEKAFLNGPVDELCAMLDDWKSTGNGATCRRKPGTSSRRKSSSA